jgi:hypothetical protein
MLEMVQSSSPDNYSRYIVSLNQEEYSLKEYSSFFLSHYRPPGNAHKIRVCVALVTLLSLYATLIFVFYMSDLWYLDYMDDKNGYVIIAGEVFGIFAIYLVGGGRTSFKLKNSFVYAIIVAAVFIVIEQVIGYVMNPAKLSIFHFITMIVLPFGAAIVGSLLEHRLSKIGTIHALLIYLALHDCRKDVTECGKRLVESIETYFADAGMIIANKEEMLDIFIGRIVDRDLETLSAIKNLREKESFDRFIELNGYSNFFAVKSLSQLRVRENEASTFGWFVALVKAIFGPIKFTKKTLTLFFKRHVRVVISIISSAISFLPMLLRFIAG